MDLTPNDVGFDLATTARAIAQNTAALPPDIGTVEEVLQAAGYPPPKPPAAPDGGGGGGKTTPTAAGPPNLPAGDWATSFFSSLGLPGDVQAKVNQIFTQYSDVNAASAAAIAYIRGTPWYAQTYPGIQDAITRGLVSDEAGYRGLLNQQTQVYKQYAGRDITSAEFAANLKEGASVDTLAKRFQGTAYVGAYGPDIRYALGNFGEGTPPSGSDLQALGEQEVGLSSPVGVRLERALEQANKRLLGVFGGTLGSPSLTLAGGRLASQRVASAKPDVAA